jgi:hypothetical protein
MTKMLSVMRSLLLTSAALIVASAQAATVGNVWSIFCQRHLIADIPAQGDPAYKEEIVRLHYWAPEPRDFAMILIKEYRSIGAEIYWLRGDLTYRHHLQNYLQTLGDELRLISPNSDLAGEISKALLDYQAFEKWS